MAASATGSMPASTRSSEAVRSGPCRYVPALAIEKVVVEQIRELAKSKHKSSETNDALAPFQDHATWDSLPAAEQARQCSVWFSESNTMAVKPRWLSPSTLLATGIRTATEPGEKGDWPMTTLLTVECNLDLAGRGRGNGFPLKPAEFRASLA